MQLSFLRIFVFMAVAVTVPVTVLACEGECIVGITNAFLGNYMLPIHTVFDRLAEEVGGLLHGQHGSKAASQQALSYLRPILDAYNNESYPTLQYAIFPGYFHGKCQRGVNNVDPSGCPNPDCPVVCGTPGSLVHFYQKLLQIVFQSTKGLLVKMASPGSAAYGEVEKAVVAAASEDGSTTKNRLRQIMGKTSDLLADSCGGTEELSRCSWEAEMKPFILSFP